MFDFILAGLVALLFLALMEIVLGIDNIVFIAVITERLPEQQRPKARKVGLIVALVMRLALLLVLGAIMSLNSISLFELSSVGIDANWFAREVPHELDDMPDEVKKEVVRHFEQDAQKHIDEINQFSLRDLVLLLGGLFLIGKSVVEIHEQTEGGHEKETKRAASFASALVQIALLDMVFSLDSVITAIGMVNTEDNYWGGIGIMVTAIVIAVGVMLAFANPVSDFVWRNPTVKMLALSFLILIGILLVSDSIGAHIPKGYIYFAMAFALIVEMLNLRVRTKKTTIAAHDA